MSRNQEGWTKLEPVQTPRTHRDWRSRARRKHVRARLLRAGRLKKRVKKPTLAEALVVPKDREELHAWILEWTGVNVPRVTLIEGNTAPFEYVAHSFFVDTLVAEKDEGGGVKDDGEDARGEPKGGGGEAETSGGRGEVGSATRCEFDATDCVVWANRGGGKTFYGALATFLDLIFKDGIEVRILAGSKEQSRRMYNQLCRLFGRKGESPFAKMIERKVFRDRLVLKTGSCVELLAQAHTSVRGTRVHKLRCDEVDLFSEDIWEAAQMVTRSGRCGKFEVRGTVECFSTMHEVNGVMQRLVNEAGEGTRKLFRWNAVDVLERCGPERRCRANGQTSDGQMAKAEEGGQGTAEPRTSNIETAEPHISGSQISDAGTAGAQESDGKASAAADGAASGCAGAGASSPSVGGALGDCPLWDECGGRAKKWPEGESGFMKIDDAIRQKRRVVAAAWKSEMLCERPRRSNAMVPEFDPAVHVFSDDAMVRARAERWIAGMDFGYRETAVLWAALDRDGVVWVVDERCDEDMLLGDHIVAMKAGLARPGVPAWPRPAWIGVDPSGVNRSDQTGIGSETAVKQAGFRTRLVRRRTRTGLELVRSRFKPASGPPRLFIHQRCRRLIESLERFRVRLRTGEPDKTEGYDHAVDALRYMIQNLDMPVRTYTFNYAWGSYVPKGLGEGD